MKEGTTLPAAAEAERRRGGAWVPRASPVAMDRQGLGAAPLAGGEVARGSGGGGGQGMALGHAGEVERFRARAAAVLACPSLVAELSLADEVAPWELRRRLLHAQGRGGEGA